MQERPTLAYQDFGWSLVGVPVSGLGGGERSASLVELQWDNRSARVFVYGNPSRVDINIKKRY